LKHHPATWRASPPWSHPIFDSRVSAPPRFAVRLLRLDQKLIDGIQWGMPELTRRRSTDAREECWLIYYGDVRVGTIAVRSGNRIGKFTQAGADPFA
jgi:hypothetical protein